MIRKKIRSFEDTSQYSRAPKPASFRNSRLKSVKEI